MNQYLLLASGIAPLRNGDVRYPFRVDSDFLAWTRMDIEGVILLHDLRSKEQVIFFDELDEKKRLWESVRWDREIIRKQGFLGEIFPRSELRKYLEGLEGDFYLPEKIVSSTVWEYNIIREILAGREMLSADNYLTQKRLFKTESDIANICKSIEITEWTYNFLLKNAKAGMHEYEVEAMIAYQFRLHHGIEAFPSIVASGPNACTLHYTANNRKIEAGDLVLIDFGIELDGYGADISRTFPVSGSFTPRQQQLYDAVLAVKAYAESIVKPGISIVALNQQVHDYMMREIFPKIGLHVPDDYKEPNNPFMPHSIGHFLGLDVHDVGNRRGLLEPGMVITIEPGIYIHDEGIGIRIEDDYLVTKTGCQKL